MRVAEESEWRGGGRRSGEVETDEADAERREGRDACSCLAAERWGRGKARLRCDRCELSTRASLPDSQRARRRSAVGARTRLSLGVPKVQRTLSSR